jgi:hypothetical protein
MLVSKTFRRAFYWPTALGDAEELVRRCQGCQYFAKQQHVPSYKLVTIPPTWPFACWGLDMIGPLPTVPGGFNGVLVSINKFPKWIEVKPVTCPKADRVLDFLDELVHRYGLPHHIITDLGSNFNNHQFWEYCENSGIDVRYVTVAIHGPMDKSSAPMGWYSTLSRSNYTMLLTQKKASGSRNCPMHSRGWVLNPPSRRDSHPISWSTALKLFYLPMLCGTRRQYSNTTKAYLKTAVELTSMDSKKLAALPSSKQHGT